MRLNGFVIIGVIAVFNGYGMLALACMAFYIFEDECKG